VLNKGLSKITRSNLLELTAGSWELGTRAQALLEFDSLSYSALTVGASIPPSSNDPPSSLNSVLTVANVVVGNLKGVTPRPEALIAGDASAADPASIGVAVVLANWTGQGSDGLNYSVAASNQFEYLLTSAPKTGDGAISHRNEQVQLWYVHRSFFIIRIHTRDCIIRSDSVYMVPPFLAYYGVITGNQSAISGAYNQCKLYRDYLRDDNASGLWKHIELGTGVDQGHWSTGEQPRNTNSSLLVTFRERMGCCGDASRIGNYEELSIC
jgi:hypothetical protein